MIEISIDRETNDYEGGYSYELRNNDTIDGECRICFDPETPDNKLIYPCLCSGTSKYIHENCLRKWRMENYGLVPYKRCMECRFEYLVDSKYPVEYKLYKSISLLKISVLYFFMNMVLNIMLYFDSQFVLVDYFLVDYNPYNYTVPNLYINKTLINNFNITNKWVFKRMLVESDIYLELYHLFLSCYLVNNLEHITYAMNFIFNINRKLLFLKLDFKNELIYLINNSYFIFFLNVFANTENHFWFFISCSFFPFFYCLNCNNVIKYRNDIIDCINKKYNQEKVINYERDLLV